MVHCRYFGLALLHFAVAQGITLETPPASVPVGRPAKNVEEAKAVKKARWKAEADEKLRLRLKAERNKERLAVKMDRETRAKGKMDADAALRTEVQAKKKEEHKKQMAELAEKHAAELVEKQKKKEVKDEQRRQEREKAPLKARWQAILAEKKKKANMTQEQRLEHIEATENSLREEKLEEMAIKARMKAKMERDDAFRMAQAKRRQMATEGKRRMAETGLRKLEWSKKQVAKDKKDREIEARIQQAKMEPVQQDDEDADVIYVNVHRDAEEIRLKVQRSARFKVLFDVICHRFHLVRPTVSFLLNGTPLNEQDTPDKAGFKGDEAIIVQGGETN